MSDIINLLPDAVANQIAAGEVIQRPASAVKELLENAIDAGADTIKLVIKDAGKALIQVIDNGRGMSPTDARMCFERHSTSKISKAVDLFSIRTMGFRGEALASIAAIAQVELKTKPFSDEMGTVLLIEGSKVKSQETEALAAGTTFNVRNLYFNTPARRNFLKSNLIENRHIIDEFTRVAMLNPEISFSYFNDERQILLLPASNLRQRITGLMGRNYQEKLLKVEEKTELIGISGFVGKPEIAKKTRGEQFLFVNRRFIKHPYLHHAIVNAFDEIIPNSYFPSYFINLDIDPAQIDVNIHPTKTEVNFQDERVIYSILRAAVRMALGKYSLSPTFEFDQDAFLNFNPPAPGVEIKQPVLKINADYNPFETSKATNTPKQYQNTAFRVERTEPNKIRAIENIYEEVSRVKLEDFQSEKENDSKNISFESEAKMFQFDRRYIVTTIKSNLLLIDQQAAHERILYDRFSSSFDKGKNYSQGLLFPEKLNFSNADIELLGEIYDDLHILGFEISRTKENEFTLTACPSDLMNENPQKIIDQIIDQYKSNLMQLKIDKRQNLLLSMCRNAAIKAGTYLQEEEMHVLLRDLFVSSAPEFSPFGKKIIKSFSNLELIKQFNA